MKNLYKLSYVWYEGDTGECYLITDKEEKEIEALLKKGIQTVNKYPERGFGSSFEHEKGMFIVKCLPAAYEHLIEWLQENDVESGEIMDWSHTYEVCDGAKDTFTIERVWKETYRKRIASGTNEKLK